MKSPFVYASVTAVLLLTGCSQSPEKLLRAANKYHDAKKYQEASILYQKVIVKDKTNAEAYYRQGINLLDQGKIPDAAGYLRRAIDLQPANTDAEVRLTEIYLAAYARDPRRYKSLLTDIRDLDNKILQHQPNSFEGIRLQGLIQMADNQDGKALDSFAKANRIKPHARDLISWYAECLVRAQKRAEAIALVEDMLAHDKTWGPGYDFLFMQYQDQREKQEAVLRDRVKNDPANAAAIANYANYLLAMKRFPESEAVMRKVLDDKKSFPNGHELLGDYYIRAKKPDLALAEYRLGQKEDPKNLVRYQERIVGLEEYTGHSDEATELAKQLVETNPKDVSANQVYASILLDSGVKSDAKKSLEELKKLLQNNPGDPVLHLDMARAYFGVGDKDKALAEADETMQVEQKGTDAGRPAIMAPARIIAARIYEDRGQHAKAIELAELVLAAQPGNPDATLIRARALIGTNEVEKAVPDLETLIRNYPKLNDARLALAGVYVSRRQFDKAQEQFAAVYNSNPPDMRGFIGLQTLKLATGKSAEGIQAMQDLVDKNPTALPYRYQLANILATAGAQEVASNPADSKQLLQRASDQYKEILKTTANASQVWLRLGVIQRQLRQYDQALASFEQAGNADPKNAEAFLNLALLSDALGKRKEAADSYNKVLSIDPENALALNNLAYLTADSGSNLDQAMTFAERAKKRAPNSADVSDTLGYVYYQKNLNGEALRIFRQIVQDNPKNSTFRFHLAMALLKGGDKQGARDEAQKALQNAPSPDQQNKIRSFVSQIG